MIAASIGAGAYLGRDLAIRNATSRIGHRRVDHATAPVVPSGVAVLYSRAACRDSAQAKAWLAGQGIVVDERSIDDSPQALAEVRRLGAKRTPLLLVGRHQIEGFDPAVVTRYLREEGMLPVAAR